MEDEAAEAKASSDAVEDDRTLPTAGMRTVNDSNRLGKPWNADVLRSRSDVRPRRRFYRTASTTYGPVASVDARDATAAVVTSKLLNLNVDQANVERQVDGEPRHRDRRLL